MMIDTLWKSSRVWVKNHRLPSSLCLTMSHYPSVSNEIYLFDKIVEHSLGSLISSTPLIGLYSMSGME